MPENLTQSLRDARYQTDLLFSLLVPGAIYERPVPERHRLIFYLGHLEAFDWNQIAVWGLSEPRFCADSIAYLKQVSTLIPPAFPPIIHPTGPIAMKWKPTTERSGNGLMSCFRTHPSTSY